MSPPGDWVCNLVLRERSKSAAVVTSVNDKELESPVLMIDVDNGDEKCGLVRTFNSNSVKRLVGLYCEFIEDRDALTVLSFSSELSCEL